MDTHPEKQNDSGSKMEINFRKEVEENNMIVQNPKKNTKVGVEEASEGI